MIHAWLDLPLGGILGWLALFYAATAALLFWLLFYSPLRAPIVSCAGVVAPYFGAIALLFSLLTGFLAADIADRNPRAGLRRRQIGYASEDKADA